MEPQPQAAPGDLQLGLQKGSDPRPPSFQLLLAGVISGSFPLGEQLRLQAEAVAACPGPVRHQPPLWLPHRWQGSVQVFPPSFIHSLSRYGSGAEFSNAK